MASLALELPAPAIRTGAASAAPSPLQGFVPALAPQLAEVERLLGEAIDAEDPRVVGLARPLIMRRAKRVRPLLSLLCCSAVDGDARIAVRVAVAVELLHNFTLIHDDIEDSAPLRRGTATLHSSFGVPVALNAGDALYTLVWRRVLELDVAPTALLRVQRVFLEACQRLVHGQGLELFWGWSRRQDLSEAEYLEMISGKTGALLGLACEAGTCLTPGAPSAALRRFGETLGLAYQIQDDLLDLTGESSAMGKAAGRDAANARPTLPSIHALSHAHGRTLERIKEHMSTAARSAADQDEFCSLLEDSGSIEYTRQMAQQFTEEARASLSLLPESPARAALESLTAMLCGRQS